MLGCDLFDLKVQLMVAICSFFPELAGCVLRIAKPIAKEILLTVGLICIYIPQISAGYWQHLVDFEKLVKPFSKKRSC